MTNLVVVFDLDQTIGYFTQIGILIDSIETITKRKLKLNEFFKLLDMFPLIFRKGIMKTFELLKLKKKTIIKSKWLFIQIIWDQKLGFIIFENILNKNSIINYLIKQSQPGKSEINNMKKNAQVIINDMMTY